MNDRLLLKDRARSLCPQCCREISAKVYEEPEGVIMEKNCPDHGFFRAMVEKDAAVYRTLMNAEPSSRLSHTLVIPITHRCNLACSMCFFPNDGVADPSREAICRMIDEYEGQVIAFSGGEPTLRQDLPALINYATRRNKITCVVSNGLLLQDQSMVQKLADAGLKRCLLSFNGLEDRVFEAIEGRPLLRFKIAALENLCKSPVQVILSSTLVPGVNDNIIPSMMRILVRYSPRIFNLRIRTHSAIGRHRSVPNLHASELVLGICRACKLDVSELLKSLREEPAYHGATHFYVWLAHFKDQNRIKIGGSPMSECHPGAKQRLASIQKSRVSGSCQAYVIRMFAWPDIMNLDLDEDCQSGVWHIGPGGKALPFFQAVIMNQHKPDWSWG